VGYHQGRDADNFKAEVISHIHFDSAHNTFHRARRVNLPGKSRKNRSNNGNKCTIFLRISIGTKFFHPYYLRIRRFWLDSKRFKEQLPAIVFFQSFDATGLFSREIRDNCNTDKFYNYCTRRSAIFRKRAACRNNEFPQGEILDILVNHRIFVDFNYTHEFSHFSSLLNDKEQPLRGYRLYRYIHGHAHSQSNIEGNISPQENGLNFILG